MIRIVNEEDYRVCAECDAGMKKMPGLDGVYMCEKCSSLKYRLPSDWQFSEDEEEAQDKTLYQEEISGE